MGIPVTSIPLPSDGADAHESSGVTIRPIAGTRELEACVRLQLDTWGQGFSDVVPGSLLQISAKMGGVVSGAFNEEGELVGVVYGLTGLKDGELAHWSHMLAVREDLRNAGLGRRLKLHQRRGFRRPGAG